MERLTFEDAFGEPCYKLNGVVYKNEISSLLSAYENTGLTPEEINNISEKRGAQALACLEEKYGISESKIIDLMEADKAGKVLQYIPGDTVYDCFGMSWMVTSSEIHKFNEGPLRYLYRCGHPGTDDYCALYSDEILTKQEAERIACNERSNLL